MTGDDCPILCVRGWVGCWLDRCPGEGCPHCIPCSHCRPTDSGAAGGSGKGATAAPVPP